VHSGRLWKNGAMLRTARLALCLLALAQPLPGCSAAPAPHHRPAWHGIQPGVEYAKVLFETGDTAGKHTLHVVRVDPGIANVVAVMASQLDQRPRTAGAWCRTSRLSVAINLGMFHTNGLSHVGYLRSGTHENSSLWNQYRSVLALYPRREDLPKARWLDLDAELKAPSLRDYAIVVQNLRLIRAPGKNCWEVTSRKWSEAAIAEDRTGRLLFLFTRTPLSMPEFNRVVLSGPLDVLRAMHVEGGPEASLSIHAGGIDLDLCGSFETGFRPDDSNAVQWPIPNVLGVARVP
jgi:hypothetical protein